MAGNSANQPAMNLEQPIKGGLLFSTRKQKRFLYCKGNEDRLVVVSFTS